MSKKSIALAELRKIEETHSLTGGLPMGRDANHEVYLSRYKDWDARKGEGLVLKDGDEVHPLLKARMLIFRGKTAEARQVLAALRADRVENRSMNAEAQLEEARAALLEGDWLRGWEIADQAMSQEPAPVTRLALLQVRALAAFESGHFLLAHEDLETIQSLATVFPFSTSATYAKALEIRLLARNSSPEAGRVRLLETWRHKLTAKDLTLDNLSVFLRAEIDLRRLEGADHASWALASLLVERAAGDQIYEGLAWVDLANAGVPEWRAAFAQDLSLRRERFARIERLSRELVGSEFLSVTGQTILEFKGGERAFETPLPVAEIEKITRLYFPALGLTVALKPFTFSLVGGGPQMTKLVENLSHNPVSKDELFRRVWGGQKYVPYLHDGLIRNFIHRARKLGVEIAAAGGMLSAPGTLVVR